MRKLEIEKIQKTEDGLKKDDVVNLTEMFSELMNAYGLFAESLGKIQKEHKESYDELFSFEAAMKLPEMLSKVMDSDTPPELQTVMGDAVVDGI